MSQVNRCGVCGEEGNITFIEKYNTFSLWECAVCHGQFWTPFKNPGSEWYAHDERNIDRSINPLRKPERNHKEFLKDSEALLRQGFKGRRPTLLDVGMGTGNFLAGAVAEGYDGYGIDFDDNAIKTAKEIFKLNNVFNLDLEGVAKKYKEHFFDVITLFEVLEHIDNLSQFMDQVKMNLKPGGYLGISVPYRNYPDSLKPNDKPPRHLTRWNKKAMKNFLEMHGFSVVHMRLIRITIPYIISKFHLKFSKYVSINLVQRVTVKAQAGGLNIQKRVAVASKLAKIKDYALFIIPALSLYIALLISGKSGLGLYVLAKKT